MQRALSHSENSRVTVIGAGFSGLCSAYFLQKLGLEVRILEAGPRAGGLIQSYREEWGLVESAANAFRSSALLESLAQDIGVPLLRPRKESRKRFIFRNGEAQRWPLSLAESASALKQFLFSSERSPLPEESVRSWGERILGAAASEYLLETALQGVYAGEPERMSASLILGRYFGASSRAKKRAEAGAQALVSRGKVKVQSVAPAQGMAHFLERLAAHLESQGVQILYNEKMSAQAVSELPRPLLLCTSAAAAARLSQIVEPELAQGLAALEMRALSSVTVAFKKDPADLEGFGCLFPRSENFHSLGVLFQSSIFEERGPHRLETWILPGSGLPLEERLRQIQADRMRLQPSQGQLVQAKLHDWPEALPHYTVELERWLASQPLDWPEQRGFFLCGNYLGSLGLTQILERCQEVASRLRIWSLQREPSSLYASLDSEKSKF